MYCGKCGNEINDNFEFCDHCGTKVDSKNGSTADLALQKEAMTGNGRSIKTPTKRTILLIIISISTILLVGLIIHHIRQALFADQLGTYININMIKVVQEQILVSNEFGSVKDANSWAEITTILYQASNDSSQLVKDAENVDTLNPKIKELHQLYISAISDRDKAISIQYAAVLTGSFDQAGESRELLNKSGQTYNKYVSKLEEMLNQYNVHSNFDFSPDT